MINSNSIIYLSVGGLIIRWNKITRLTTHQIVNIIFSIILKGQSQNHKGCAKQCDNECDERNNVNHIPVVSC